MPKSKKSREKNRIRKAKKRKTKAEEREIRRLENSSSGKLPDDEGENVETGDGTEKENREEEGQINNDVQTDTPEETGERILDESPQDASLPTEHITDEDTGDTDEDTDDTTAQEEEVFVVDFAPEGEMPSEDSAFVQESEVDDHLQDDHLRQETDIPPPSSREIPEKCPACKASTRVFRMPSTHNGQRIIRTMVSPCDCGEYYGFIDPPL